MGGFEREEPQVISFHEVRYETEDAYLIEFNEDEEDVWIPKSEVVELDVDNCELTIPYWLAYEKGLI